MSLGLPHPRPWLSALLWLWVRPSVSQPAGAEGWPGGCPPGAWVCSAGEKSAGQGGPSALTHESSRVSLPTSAPAVLPEDWPLEGMGFPRVEAQLTGQSGTPRGGGTAGKSVPSVPLHGLQTCVPLKERSVRPRGERTDTPAVGVCTAGSVLDAALSRCRQPLVGRSWGSPVLGSRVSAPGGSGRGSLGTCYTSTAGGRGRVGPGYLQGQRDRSLCPTDSTTGMMSGGRRSSAPLPSTSTLS